jgi:hypothetical protein
MKRICGTTAAGEKARAARAVKVHILLANLFHLPLQYYHVGHRLNSSFEWFLCMSTLTVHLLFDG